MADRDKLWIYEIPVASKFGRWQNIGEWQVAAQDKAVRLQHVAGFVRYMIPSTPRGLKWVYPQVLRNG